MSMSYGQFTLSQSGNGLRAGQAMAAILSVAALALMLTVTHAPAAPGEQTVEEKPRSVVAVFRLDGPVTEVPADDLERMFGPPGASLKDLVTRLSKAAADPAVKAVVILPETGWLGSAQIEELRAAMALVRKQDKEVFVHADSLALGQYVLACGASRISVVPAGALLIPGLHPGVAGQTRRQAGLPDRRRLQERGGAIHTGATQP
jgi:ClpP class serine protease